jgi:hypothetical protein
MSQFSEIGLQILALLFATAGGFILGKYGRTMRLKTKEEKHREQMIREAMKKKPLDPTKRRSLQPGQHPMPKGFREALDFEAVPVVPKVIAKEETKKALLSRQSSRSEKEDHAAKHDGFYHKFFGSQLIVGERVVLSGLTKKIHAMEITKSGQLFVDNIPFEMNPTDIVRMREELAKSRTL